MLKKYYIAALVIVLIGTYIPLKAQDNIEIIQDEFNTGKKGFPEAWKNVKQGNKYFEENTKGSYSKALDYYLEAYKFNPDNPELNYKIGICYLNSIFKAESLNYLLKVKEIKPAISKKLNWYLGNAYHYNSKFEEAISYYEVFYQKMESTDIRIFRPETQKRIEECKTGIELIKQNRNVKIENISNLNSAWPDYSPVISADESVIVFTSRRSDASQGAVDKYDGQNYEDIYISYNINDQWLNPQNIGEPLNTNVHDATVGLSPDGQQMLIYRNGDIYICTLQGEKWSEPELLPETINSPNVENSACFSTDANTIYFIRGRTQDPITSNGEIYFSTKNKGKWTNPKKLPPTINTKYDEDGVFMHPDGKTLYYSSRGIGTMGGFDIFRTRLNNDGTWETPVNMGYPINTPDDDVYFVIAASGQHAYYSSVKNDSKGYTDIYKITFLKDIQVDTTQLITQVTESELTLVTGVIKNKETNEPIEATVEIYDNEKNQIVSTVTSNSKTGKFLVSLPSGKNYGMLVKSNNYLFHSENFNINENQTFTEIKKDISMSDMSEGSKVTLKNLFFDVNSANIRTESYAELAHVEALLRENPNIRLEISGHTDNTGSKEHNKTLSEQRAKAVYDYLIIKKINQTRLLYRGAGFDEPVAPNLTQAGRQENRRVEIKIIK